MQQQILIVGGTGYIGSHLSLYLAQKGYKVTVFGRFDPRHKYQAWCVLMEDILIGDILDKTTMQVFAERQFDIVIHLIALNHKQSESNPEVFSINTLSTWQLLEHFVQQGTQRFLYFSTQHALGSLPPIIIDESYPPQPKNRHGFTHFLSEQIINYFNDTTAISAASIRLSNAYGSPVFQESRCWQYVINELCKMAVEKEEIHLLSDGSSLRDFIHILDICRFIEILINTDNVDNIYHLSSGKTHTILEIAHIIQHVYRNHYGKDISVYFPKEKLSKNSEKHKNTNRYTFLTQKMQNFKIELDITKGIEQIFTYFDNKYMIN